ncbi:DUF2846 domain-containing protein [Actinobacillus genomosp. 1]|uniref:DUF2846 domain-containing protein n=1 Tax=Actinobacillus genomosp. 1 TaxID=254839 RepID=UPI002441D565|nr:DUF2846 domain-containing protein [Actinobacillus genomosp. 1]WGE36218.1 DUF2846 domain-containing protein [Actinobacillus genomosp. 1]
MKKLLVITAISTLLSACATVPMASVEKSNELKQFNSPAQEHSGIYIYRPNSVLGAALKKNIYLDDQLIGETAKGVFFHKLVSPGTHKVATESEFSDNAIVFSTVGGQNYFVRQYMKIGAFVGGAGVELVDEKQAKMEMADVHLAK